MSIGKTIKDARKNAGLTQTQLGEKVYKSAQVISNWERGYTTGITAEDIKNLSSALQVPASKFIDGNPQKPSGIFKIQERTHVPVIGSVRCGAGGLAYEYIDEYITIDDKYRQEEVVAFRAVGDSMEGDYIFDGNICLVHLQEDVEDGAIAVVVIDGEEGTLKRVRKQPNMIILEASNSAYPPRVFAGADANLVRIVGRVIEVRQKK